jgi:hypothetical protein
MRNGNTVIIKFSADKSLYHTGGKIKRVAREGTGE